MNVAVHLHPTLVHFPIALIVAASIFSFIAWKTGSRTWLHGARVILVGAAVGGMLAAAAGFLAEEAGNHPEAAHDLLERHEALGYWVAGLLAVLAWWAWRRSAQWIFWPGVAFILLVYYQGYLGGQLVYKYGVGVMSGEQTDNSHVHNALPEDNPDRVPPSSKGFGDGSIATH